MQKEINFNQEMASEHWLQENGRGTVSLCMNAKQDDICLTLVWSTNQDPETCLTNIKT